MVLAIEGAIKDGRSVELGDLGTLSPTISIIAADYSADVKIRKKRILFRPSKKLREIVNSMSIRFIGGYDDDDDTTQPSPEVTTTLGLFFVKFHLQRKIIGEKFAQIKNVLYLCSRKQDTADYGKKRY